jgi:hypothetical protein
MPSADVTVTITDTTPNNRAAFQNTAADNASPVVNNKKAAAAEREETVSVEEEDDMESDLSAPKAKNKKRSSKPATSSNYTD